MEHAGQKQGYPNFIGIVFLNDQVFILFASRYLISINRPFKSLYNVIYVGKGRQRDPSRSNSFITATTPKQEIVMAKTMFRVITLNIGSPK